MEFKIQSGKPISLELVKLIMDILRDAHCPQQVLKDNVPDYNSKKNNSCVIMTWELFYCLKFVCKLSAKLNFYAKLHLVTFS